MPLLAFRHKNWDDGDIPSANAVALPASSDRLDFAHRFLLALAGHRESCDSHTRLRFLTSHAWVSPQEYAM